MDKQEYLNNCVTNQACNTMAAVKKNMNDWMTNQKNPSTNHPANQSCNTSSAMRNH
jgi:hypothetical protein